MNRVRERRESRSRHLLVAPALVALALGLTSCGAPRQATTIPPTPHSSQRIVCQGRVAVPFGRSLLGNTEGGTDFMQGSCVRGAGSECVYTFDLASRSNVRLGLESTDFDGALVLLDGSGDPRGELACVDDTPRGDTHHARIDATLNAGRYYLVVDGVSGESGEFELFLQADALPPVAEVCASAELVTEGHPFRGRTTGAPNLFSATCAGGARGPDHVHALDLTVASRVRLRQQSEHDGALYLRASCADPSTELGCNDDFRDGSRAALALRLPAGRHYVFSDAYSPEQSGNYAISYERIDEPAPRDADAVCSEAEALAVKPGSFEVDTFTASSTLEGSCGGAGAPELALVIAVAERAVLRAELEDAELNATLYVRERCRDTASELICFRAPRIDGSAQPTAPKTALVITLEPGEYTVVVDGAEAEDMGAARLLLSLTPSKGLLL